MPHIKCTARGPKHHVYTETLNHDNPKLSIPYLPVVVFFVDYSIVWGRSLFKLCTCYLCWKALVICQFDQHPSANKNSASQIAWQIRHVLVMQMHCEPGPIFSWEFVKQNFYLPTDFDQTGRSPGLFNINSMCKVWISCDLTQRNNPRKKQRQVVLEWIIVTIYWQMIQTRSVYGRKLYIRAWDA